MAESGNVVIVTDSDFSEEIESSDGLSMVDFWAEWCGPCRIVGPVVSEIADEWAEKGLKVAKLDVDTNQATASRYGIRTIPSILFFKNGQHVDTVIGAQSKQMLEGKIQEHIAQE